MTLANSDSLDMEGMVCYDKGMWVVKYTRSVGSGLNVYSLPLDPDDVLSLDESFLHNQTPVRFFIHRLVAMNTGVMFVAKLKKP